MLHDWCNKCRSMCYPVCRMVHIKEPLLLIDKSSLCGGSGFPFSLSKWSLAICLTPHNRRQNVLSASLNKTFLSLSLYIAMLVLSGDTAVTICDSVIWLIKHIICRIKWTITKKFHKYSLKHTRARTHTHIHTREQMNEWMFNELKI